jgi:hypothetical protein
MPENLQIRRVPDPENGFIYRKDWPPNSTIHTVGSRCTCFEGLAYLKPDLCGLTPEINFTSRILSMFDPSAIGNSTVGTLLYSGQLLQKWCKNVSIFFYT